MKFLLDFFPILLFFIAYKWQGIYAATVIAIAASAVQLAYFWFKTKRFENTHVATFLIITIFGGLTLYLQDDTFIKWKPTIVNWLFGLVCIGSQFIGKRPLIQRIMAGNISLPNDIWIKLNAMWATFFIFSGAANLFVMYNFDTDTWVNFKLFGMLGFTLLFVVLQGFFLMKYIEDEPTEQQEISTEKDE
ncbi:MAG: septation protein A [Piscirickettsiaceae bacterium]|nr:MAG: septation protein A [Piscirickettsiaceae bacterium]